MTRPFIREARDADLDERQLEAMLASTAWQAYTRRVQADFDRALAQCASEKDEIELRRRQGAVLALRGILALPANMLEELKAKRARRAE